MQGAGGVCISLCGIGVHGEFRCFTSLEGFNGCELCDTVSCREDLSTGGEGHELNGRPEVGRPEGPVRTLWFRGTATSTNMLGKETKE